MTETLQRYLANLGIPVEVAGWTSIAMAVLVIAGLAYAIDVIGHRMLGARAERLMAGSQSRRAEIFGRHRLPSRLAHLLPCFVVYLLGPVLLGPDLALTGYVQTAAMIALIIAGVLFLDALINAGVDIYNTYAISRELPITSFAQVAKIVLYFLAVISCLALVFGQSPLSLLAGLGALAAVFMFVFKDPILGFVAGIQLSANRMVAVGDWIEMPKYGVDGDVMEIGLTTVKIRNFDKTITTIPTYGLITDSFKNWRGMKETGGRRIKRAVRVDLSTIRFCDDEMLRRYAKIQYIGDYLQQKKTEIDQYNAENTADMSSLVNGRRLTNVGTFRAYVEAYLRHHPQISQSLTFLVRQLPPDEMGLPIQIYVFCLDTNWVNYEKIQADIFDHILAVVREFDLAVFQNPAGTDFRTLTAGRADVAH